MLFMLSRLCNPAPALHLQEIMKFKRNRHSWTRSRHLSEQNGRATNILSNTDNVVLNTIRSTSSGEKIYKTWKGGGEEEKKKITQYNQKNKLNIYLSLLVDSLSPHLEHIHFVFLFFPFCRIWIVLTCFWVRWATVEYKNIVLKH